MKVKLMVFNDEKEDKPVYRREHAIMFQMEIISGASTTPFTAEQRKWSGKSDICLNSKKRLTFVGVELGKTRMPDGMIDTRNKTFIGVQFLSSNRPEQDEYLLPLERDNRTLIG